MPTRSIECACCYMEALSSQTTKCNGSTPHIFCFTCVRSYINASIDNGKINLDCMDTNGCNGKLTQKSLSRILDKSILARFESIQANSAIREVYGNDLTTCPFCTMQFINDHQIDDHGILQCINPECGIVSCTKCRKAEHYPDPCSIEHSQRISKEEADTYKVIKACPTCNVDIFKIDGCSHMRCTNCKNTMCYICGIDITANISGHGCPIFTRSDNVPVSNRRRYENRQPVRIPANRYNPINHNYDTDRRRHTTQYNSLYAMSDLADQVLDKTKKLEESLNTMTRMMQRQYDMNQ